MPVSGLIQIAVHREAFGKYVTFGRDDNTWATATNGRLSLWMGDEEVTSAFPGHQFAGLSFSTTSDSVNASPYRFNIHSMDLTPDTQTLQRQLTVGLDPAIADYWQCFEVDAASHSPDGGELVVAASFRPPRGIRYKGRPIGRPAPRLLLLDGTTAQFVAQLGSHSQGYTTVLVGQRWIVAASRTLWVYDRASRDEAAVGTRHRFGVRAICFDTGESRMATGGSNGQIGLWSVPSSEPTELWDAHQGDVTFVAFHSRPDTLLSAARDGSLRMWDISGSPRLKVSLDVGGQIEAGALSPSGLRVALSIRGDGDRLELYEVIP